MRYGILGCLLFGISASLFSQGYFQNQGNLRIFENGEIGFYSNLVNNAEFDNNHGLAGFYGPSLLHISGKFIPIFNELELANDHGVLLENSIGVSSHINFISGDLQTQKSLSEINVKLLFDSFYTGASDFSKVDGYVLITQEQNIIFPVGDAKHLRALIVNSENMNPVASCAYFNENPNNPTSQQDNFDTRLKSSEIQRISFEEFWILNADVSSQVLLSWTPESKIGNITNNISNLAVVGWNKDLGRWVSLGSEQPTGTLSQGFVKSSSFVPSEYAVLSFGVLDKKNIHITFPNYLLTPNEDGVNDRLEIAELEKHPKNRLKIYDRTGIMVYDKLNYKNEFTGKANKDTFLNGNDSGLREGVYFYILSLEDNNTKYQGFLYLER